MVEIDRAEPSVLVIKWRWVFRFQPDVIVAMACPREPARLMKWNLLGETMKHLMLLFLILPGLTQAQIFRCQEKGETWFSQIPCTDDSEAVVVEDQPLLSQAVPESVDEPPAQPVAAEPARTQAENMQEFVSTLHRQRIEQLQQIDEDIGALAARLQSIGDAPSDEEQRKQLAAQLAEMRSSRSSIEEQYESMISEAERRVVALSARNVSAENTVN